MVVNVVGMKIYLVEFFDDVVKQVATLETLKVFFEIELFKNVGNVFAKAVQVSAEVDGNLGRFLQQLLEIVTRPIVKPDFGNAF